MNRTILFAGAGALGSALLVAMLLSATMGKKDADVPATEILVAGSDLPIGTTLTSGNTHWQKWGGPPVAGSLVRSHVKDDQWQKQKIRRALTKDEPVTEGAMLKDNTGSLLAGRLEKEMRAVSIDVKPSSGVSGFLAPDDHVDVLLTYNVRVQANTSANALQELAMEKATETILENIRVLATDQDAKGEASADGKAKISKTVTLEVTRKGAEKLALATQLGEIHLALRPIGEEGEKDKPLHEDVSDVTMTHILKKVIATRNAMESSGRSVRIYSGNTVQEVPIHGTGATP